MRQRGEYLAAWLLVALTVCLGFLRWSRRSSFKEVTLRPERTTAISLESPGASISEKESLRP